MTRLVETWHVGQSVWAHGASDTPPLFWLCATITRIGYKRIEVLLTSGRYSSRLPEDLRPRDKALEGKDKPEPLKEVR